MPKRTGTSDLPCAKRREMCRLPLAGIRVLELGWWVAVPAACALLGEWGAEVIKIEGLQGGDPTRAAFSSLGAKRSQYFWDLDNRNKRSVAIDLKKEKGKEIGYKLIQVADILVTNFTQEALCSLGMDYDNVTQINPRIVYVQLTAYGTKGPDAKKGAFDYGAFWAKSGIMAAIGEPDSPPPAPRPGFGDHSVSLHITTGALLGLMARDQTGKGTKIDISLQSAGMWATSRDIQACLTTGEDISRASRKSAANPLLNSYQTKEEKWIMLMMSQTDPFWTSFCRAIDAMDLENDARFNCHGARCENNISLVKILDETISQKTISEWASIFDREGVLWAPVLSPLEVINDVQTIANDYIVSFDHPSKRKLRLVGSPIQFNGEQPKIRRPAPELGEATEEILLGLGYDWTDITQLKQGDVII